MKIDAHQHFWQFDSERDAWMTDEMEVIRQDFMPADLKPHLERAGIDGCIAVQADQSETENDFLLTLANEYSWIKGVVGWADLRSESLEDSLARLKQNNKFKGVRHIVQAEPEGFMIADDFVKGVSLVGKHDLTYDLLITESQLAESLDFIKRLPEMPIVIDHIGKPNIKEGSFDHMTKYMRKIAQYEHVHVKLSGMVTEADWYDWSEDKIKPYIDFFLETFGASRLMFGSDWPVCNLAASYEAVFYLVKNYVGQLSKDEQDQIMGLTAQKFYHIN